MSTSPSTIPGMGQVDGRGRATMLGTSRKGYHVSHVITPYVREMSTIESRRAFELWRRYNPYEPIVWRRSGRGLYWTTLKAASLEDELLKMARRRERGIRQSIATLARWTGATADLVSRVLRSLAKRGIGSLVTERGRHARATFRLFANSIPQPIRHRDAALNEERLIASYRKRYSDEEWAELMRLGELWREGLKRSLAAVGFEGPDAEPRYLAYMAELYR